MQHGDVQLEINELHPVTLELGLSAAIEWQLQQMERRQGLECQLSMLDDSATLDQQQIDALFHIDWAALCT
jgi:signal transduction histidine kinase